MFGKKNKDEELNPQKEDEEDEDTDLQEYI